MAILNARYRSACLHRFVTFTVVLPYEKYGDRFFTPNEDAFAKPEPMKTLYLLHGVTGDEMDWLYGTRIAAYAEQYRIAVVMPNGGNSFYVDQGVKEEWGRFVGEELVEVTRSMFPLSDRREDTYIGGLSMGGYGAMRCGLSYHDTFSKIISLSGAMISEAVKSGEAQEDENAPIYRRAFGDPTGFAGSDMDLEDLYSKNGADTDLFMAIGTEDFLLGKNRRYRDFLSSQGARLTYYEEPGAHEWDFWDRNIKRALAWIAGEK